MKLLLNILLLPYNIIKGLAFIVILLLWLVKLFFSANKDIKHE